MWISAGNYYDLKLEASNPCAAIDLANLQYIFWTAVVSCVFFFQLAGLVRQHWPSPTWKPRCAAGACFKLTPSVLYWLLSMFSTRLKASCRVNVFVTSLVRGQCRRKSSHTGVVIICSRFPLSEMANGQYTQERAGKAPAKKSKWKSPASQHQASVYCVLCRRSYLKQVRGFPLPLNKHSYWPVYLSTRSWCIWSVMLTTWLLFTGHTRAYAWYAASQRAGDAAGQVSDTQIHRGLPAFPSGIKRCR